jgi:hypothetical protein
VEYGYTQVGLLMALLTDRVRRVPAWNKQRRINLTQM